MPSPRTRRPSSSRSAPTTPHRTGTRAATPLGTPGSATATIVSNAPPTVTIPAPAATAREIGPTAGVFTVTRTGPTSTPLTVLYAVTGTATAGSDYQGLPGSVTLPTG